MRSLRSDIECAVGVIGSSKITVLADNSVGDFDAASSANYEHYAGVAN
jgi:hypothetical protein